MNELAPIDVERGHALAKFERLSRILAHPLSLDQAADVERELSLLEYYARSAGLFRPEESLEFRLGRFLARWRLGGRWRRWSARRDNERTLFPTKQS
jgi:hypothetical protein